MADESILDRLTRHRTVGNVPIEQLEWMANAGHLRVLETGDILTASGGAVGGMYVILDGHLSIRVDRGAGPRIVMEWHGGDVTGLLPYSRLRTPPGNVVAEEHTEILMVEPAGIREMINACHELTAVMVHVMIDRARVFKSSELLDEKLVSLGRMAAGLAHELNNPASAVARSAKTLVSEIERLDGINKQVGQLNLSDTQYFSIATLRDEHNANPVTLTPIEVADREDAMADWLEEKGVGGVEVEQLAASAFGPSDLDALSAAVGVNKVGPVLSHIASEQSVRRLAREINTAASRIHALVDAVKGFTYMDQQTTLQPIAIGRGLSDTIIVLGSKARAKATEVQLDIAPDLPAVDGYGGELNQVWSNLIDNAIDAAPKGKVRVAASLELGKIVVRVTDNGKGIPDSILPRIFDPFFTTKPVGEGTGLGLDISRRIVQRHYGALDVTTSEHGTEFRVTLPVSAAAQ